jgi:hypothetical protein
MSTRSALIATVVMLVGAVAWLGYQFSAQTDRINVLQREVSITERMAREAESGAIDAQSSAKDASIRAEAADDTQASTSVLSEDVAPRRRRIASYDRGADQTSSLDAQPGFAGGQSDVFGRQDSAWGRPDSWNQRSSSNDSEHRHNRDVNLDF